MRARVAFLGSAGRVNRIPSGRYIESIVPESSSLNWRRPGVPIEGSRCPCSGKQLRELGEWKPVGGPNGQGVATHRRMHPGSYFDPV